MHDPEDWGAARNVDNLEAALNEERRKFQQETLRTSELSAMLRLWLQRAHDQGCRADAKTKRCATCDLMEVTQELLDKPINAFGVGVCRAKQIVPSEWVCDCNAPGAGCKPTGIRRHQSDPRARGVAPSQALSTDTLARAADFLEQYADFIRCDVMSVDIERHPYLPELEDVAAEVRSAAGVKASADASAWWTLVMGAAASIEDAANCLRDPDAKKQADGAAKHYREAAQKLMADDGVRLDVAGQPAALNKHGCSCGLPHGFHRPTNPACPLNRTAGAKGLTNDEP